MEKSFKVTTTKDYNRWQFLMKLGRKLGCHQMASRSFYYKNYQFPVCARCTGILIGELIIAPISLIFFKGNMYLNIIFILIMALDGLIQYYLKKESNNKRRLITGILSGYGIMMTFIHIIVKTIELVG